MKFNDIRAKILFSFLLLLSPTFLFAQNTIVTGTVTDARTRQALQAVTVAIPGTSIGVVTNNYGKFAISTAKPFTRLNISSLGYKDFVMQVTPGITQQLNARLVPRAANQLHEVVVKSGKKPKYRNKDNPAVELIRKVIENKDKNRPESYSYVQYKEYDKMQLSLANLSPQVAEKKFFKKYAFILNNRDSSIIPGKSLLPIYLEEKLSQYYYRQKPEKTKTIVLGVKTVNLGPTIDNAGVGDYLKHMYNNVDIYGNSVFLMTNNFLSPIANSAPAFYKFFITDTIVVNNVKLVELSFTPRNTFDVLFEGKIYITLDGNYAVEKAELEITKNTNIDFVRSMSVNQEFEQNTDGRFHLSKSTTLADFGFSKKGNGGLYGIRTVTYKNYEINKPHPDTTYRNQEAVLSKAVTNRNQQFWDQNRPDTLSHAEAQTYLNLDSLQNMASYKRLFDIATLVLAGYKGFGKFEAGPLGSLYSYNPVEGSKIRVGGRTTPELSQRYYFETYLAYGFRDDRFKYFLSGTYSIKDKSIYKFPQQYLRASVQSDTHIPGEDLQFIEEDNPLLSFKRGNNTKYLYDENYRVDYVREFESHFSFDVALKRLTQSPAGSLYFINYINNIPNNILYLHTADVTLNLRYAPHEQYYQGKVYRYPIPSPYPVISFDFDAGLKNVFGSEYGYQNIHGRIDKRVYLSQLGYADVTIEGGKLFGQVPYPLLNIFRANQTYAYDEYSYNLMNFLEFVGDRYASLNIDQHFNGFFFNKIPLLKKLKWREVASFKGIYGGLSDQNNPVLHPDLYQFPVTATGQPITYALGNTPYIEGSVGVENIFKFLRVDLVHRFTYLDHPEVAKYGIRFLVQFSF